MKNVFYLAAFVLLVAACNPNETTRQEKIVLLLTEQSRMLNPANMDFVKALTQVAYSGQFKLDTLMTVRNVNEEFLKKYSAVVLLDAYQERLTPPQRVALQRYTENGGGLLVIDRPEPTGEVWQWYETLLGDSNYWDSTTQFYRHETNGAGRVSFFRLDRWRSYDFRFAQTDLIKTIDWLIGKNKYNPTLATTPPATGSQ